MKCTLLKSCPGWCHTVWLVTWKSSSIGSHLSWKVVRTLSTSPHHGAGPDPPTQKTYRMGALGLGIGSHWGFPISLVISARNSATAHIHAHASFQLHMEELNALQHTGMCLIGCPLAELAKMGTVVQFANPNLCTLGWNILWYLFIVHPLIWFPLFIWH